MSRFVRAVTVAVSTSTMAGCVAESGVMSEEFVSQDSELACDNREGTNAAIAELANAMARELGRWQITSDFYAYRGYNNQTMLGLTQAGKRACGGTCARIEAILAYQDSRTDGWYKFGDEPLSAWSFASRLVTGYENQKVCQSNGTCPFPSHAFGSTFTTAPAECGTLFTYQTTRPTSQGGGTLSAAQTAQLANALKWTTGNGPNPYIAFQSTAGTVSIDPSGTMSGGEAYELFGPVTGCNVIADANHQLDFNHNGEVIKVDALDYPCVCPGIVGTTKLKNDRPLTPKAYYCRSLGT